MPPGDCIVTPSPHTHGCLPTFWLHVQTPWLQDAQCRTLLLSTAAPASSGAVAGASWVCFACRDSYRSTATPASCTAPHRHTHLLLHAENAGPCTQLCPRAVATEAGAWKEVHVVHVLLDVHPQRCMWCMCCMCCAMSTHRGGCSGWPAERPPSTATGPVGGIWPVRQHTLLSGPLSGRSWSWAVQPTTYCCCCCGGWYAPTYRPQQYLVGRGEGHRLLEAPPAHRGPALVAGNDLHASLLWRHSSGCNCLLHLPHQSAVRLVGGQEVCARWQLLSCMA